MLNRVSISLLAVLIAASTGVFAPAQAVTVTSSASYIGDICDDFDADGGQSGTDFNDCDEIVHNGGPVGSFTMELLGLRSHIVSDALFTLSVRVADLFGADGQNNPGERFGLWLDGLNLGVLFDGSTDDEAIVSDSLAASVQANIDTAGISDDAVNLSFFVAQADLTPVVRDQRISAVFDFQGDVNSIRDVQMSVTYAAVPLPLSGLLLGMGLAGFGLARRRKTT